MKLSTVALLSLVAAVSFAQGGAPPAPKKTIKCPVMPAMKVSIAKATQNKMFADYKGRRYFFCCAACPGLFKKNPAKYAKGESIPIPK